MPSSLLCLNALEVGYHGRSILPPISIEVGAGEFWGIAGSNGSGKTTLLNSVLGLLPSIGGEVTRRRDLRVGYVPQRTSLDLSIPARAIDVVRGGATSGWSFTNLLHTYREKASISAAMAKTNVEGLAYRQLVELSEGQKQRVLMARALVCKPHLLVLDEPTSAMDGPAEAEMLALLDTLRAEQDLGIVLVSHNLMAMCSVASHALMLDREHQLILSGDIRDVAVNHEIHEHFGRLMRVAVEARFGPLAAPEECRDCDH